MSWPTLYTIGCRDYVVERDGKQYRSDKFFSVLSESGVEILVDIRMKRTLRAVNKFGFRQLGSEAEKRGIEFTYIPELGNENYTDIKATEHKLADKSRGLQKLRKHFEEGAVALLCACKKCFISQEGLKCHRMKVAALFQEMQGGAGKRLEVKHL